jgi:hypothetical protein
MKKPFVIGLLAVLAACGVAAGQRQAFDIPKDYLVEPENIPDFWITSFEDVSRFLDGQIRKGEAAVIGTSAGGRPVRAVLYGRPREGRGTTTFSGSLGFGDVRAYLGPDHGRKVYMGMAAVHGAEFEGIAGMINLLAVLETGRDLRGREWPEITTAAKALDRIILLPVTNPDGRARVPVRMERHRGNDYTVHEYLNTGGRLDGKIIGWPQCKEFIPVDFSKVQFPGGYPNDAGVNIQHDDFFGRRQPETQALLDLTARERPDLILNMHTGATFVSMLRSFIEPALNPAYEELYRRVHGRLAREKLQATEDPVREGDPSRRGMGVYNLDTALNLNCGALTVLIESPSHGFSTAKRNGEPFVHTADDLVTAQLISHQESMKYLAATGGRAKWTERPRRK